MLYQLNLAFQVLRTDAELIRSDSMLRRVRSGTFGPGGLVHTIEKKINWVYLVYTYASVLVNIFDGGG